MRLHRSFAVLLLLGAAMAKASSDCKVEKGCLPRRQARQDLAISLEGLGIIGGCW